LALVVAVPVTVIFAIITAAKTDSFRAFLTGLAGAAGLVVAQYTAAKFIRASAALVFATPTQIATPAFPDCMAILAAIGAVVLIVVGGVEAIQAGSTALFWCSLIGGLNLLAFAWVSLNPAVANISVAAGASAAQEAIAVLGYVAKVALKLVPVLFGIGAVLGTLGLICAPIPWHGAEGQASASASAGSASVHASVGWYSVGFGADTPAGIAYMQVLYAALTPIGVYVLFLGVYLLLDLANTILVACRRYLSQDPPKSA
jgi:hypothetical protein